MVEYRLVEEVSSGGTNINLRGVFDIGMEGKLRGLSGGELGTYFKVCE